MLPLRVVGDPGERGRPAIDRRTHGGASSSSGSFLLNGGGHDLTILGHSERRGARAHAKPA